MLSLLGRAGNYASLPCDVTATIQTKIEWIISIRFLSWPWQLIRPRLHETGTKSIRNDLVSVIVLFIIDVYMRPGMENAQNGQKSSCPLHGPSWLSSDRGESKMGWMWTHKYIWDRSQLRSLFRNNVCSTIPCKKQQWQTRGINQKIFSCRSHVNMLTISIFIPVWHRPVSC